MALALILRPSQIPQAFSTMGQPHEVRFGPVLMLQFAIQFVSLAVPSSAGRLAMQVRFWQRAGVPGAGAISIGAGPLQHLRDPDAVDRDHPRVEPGELEPGVERERLFGGSEGFDWGVLLIAVVLVAVAIGIAPSCRSSARSSRASGRPSEWDEAKEALRVLLHPKKVPPLGWEPDRPGGARDHPWACASMPSDIRPWRS